jgi:hypothetical protein
MPLEFERSWSDEEVESFRDSWVRFAGRRSPRSDRGDGQALGLRNARVALGGEHITVRDRAERSKAKPTEPCRNGPRCDNSVETSLARSWLPAR